MRLDAHQLRGVGARPRRGRRGTATREEPDHPEERGTRRSRSRRGQRMRPGVPDDRAGEQLPRSHGWAPRRAGGAGGGPAGSAAATGRRRRRRRRGGHGAGHDGGPPAAWPSGVVRPGTCPAAGRVAASRSSARSSRSCSTSGSVDVPQAPGLAHDRGLEHVPHEPAVAEALAARRRRRGSRAAASSASSVGVKSAPSAMRAKISTSSSSV